MFTVDEIIYNMHHFEEENFERFDEIYAEVSSGEFTLEKYLASEITVLLNSDNL